MSCLSSDALSHFEQREQELLALNQQLEKKKAQVLSESSSAIRDAESSSLLGRLRQPSAEEGAPPDAPFAEAPGGPDAEGAARAAGALPPAAAPAAPAAPPAAAPRTPGPEALEAPEALHTTVRLQSARITALQEELDRAIAELAGRDSESRRLKQELKQLSDENARLQKAAGGDGALERLKKQLAGAEARSADLEAERAELLKARDQLEVQARKHAAEAGAKDARLSRLGEECEKLKQALKEAGSQDRDRSAADRKEADRLTGEVRKLERQRAELVAAFRKQMRLVDVLKRQRAHMEAARVLSFTEDEFIRILELGDKLGE